MLSEAGKAALLAVQLEKLHKRHSAILSGEVEAGGSRGPRLDPIEKIVRDKANMKITEVARKIGKSRPQGAQLRVAIDNLIAKHGEKWRKEAEKELKAARASIEDDEGAVFGPTMRQAAE